MLGWSGFFFAEITVYEISGKARLEVERTAHPVAAAADTFRANPAFDVRTAITELAVGEALVSFLDETGVPDVVARASARPPPAWGPASSEERSTILRQSPLYGHYEQVVDRESAYEHLQSRANRPSPERASPRRPAGRSGPRQTAADALVKSVARSIGGSLGRQIVRGVLGSIFKAR